VTALVVGAARSGIALANHLTRAGEPVRVVDRRPARELRDAISRMPPGVDFRLGDEAGVLDGVAVSYTHLTLPTICSV